MRKFTARNNFRKLFIMAIIFASLLSVIPIMGFMKHSSKNQEIVVEYDKGYGDNLIQKYNKGEKLNLPTPPTRKGFDFVGWFLKEDNKLIVNEEIFINKELTIYAKWEKKQYVLHYENSSLILNFESLFVKERDRLKIVSGEHVDDIFYPNKDGFTFNKFIIKNEENIFDVDTFSFDEIEGEDIYLIPVFDENFVNFEMAESCLFKVENLSHQNKVSVFDKLYFEITLDESVSQSNINITASSGEVYMAEMGGKYFVEIKNFNQNFSINIENVELNKYSIVFNNEGEFLEQNFVHGQNLVVPQIEKGGYKLIGFKDEKGRYYYSDYIVHCDLMLFAVWEEELYKVLFPRTNGMFVINFEGETLTTSKEVVKKYQESLNFSIKLSIAYNNSNVIVYGKTKLRNINFRLEDGVYYLDNICSDVEIVVENITLNCYSITVDGTNYGEFGYGSWIYVDGDEILIKNILTNEEVKIKTLINDDNFGGWVCNNHILVNCIVQDIADDGQSINIQGNYSKKVARIKLIPNGGNLEETEIIVVEGQELTLPIPTKFGYKFVGWFVKLIEVNTIVDESLSVRFNLIDNVYMVLYAGWTK